MFSRKVLWGALAIVMMVCLDLIVVRFLLVSVPILAVLMIVIMSIVFLATLPVLPFPETRRAYKTMFLAALVVSSGFTVGVYTGLFESMSLLDDSWIDVSHSAMIFHVKNNGFIDWTIKEVKVGNITFTLKFPGHGDELKDNLQAGDTAYLIIYYCDNIFQWIPSAYSAMIEWNPAFDPRYPMDWHCTTKEEVTPSTFQNGSSHQVIFVTNGVLKHNFAVEAKFTLDEKLNVTARKWLSDSSREIWVRFNNTGEYYSYIYTIQIVNVTFYFKPPLRVPPSSWEEMRLYFRGGEGLVGWGVRYYGDVYATPTPYFYMLQIGTTYTVIVKTMTDNLYITNITL